MKKLLILAGVVSAGIANAVLIDDFGDPQFVTGLTGGSYVDSVFGTMLSGERDTEMLVLANPAGQFADLIVAGNVMTYSNGFLMESILWLQYDVMGDTTNGFAGDINNLVGTPGLLPGYNDRVELSWLGNDLDVLVAVVLRTGGVVTDTNFGVRLGGSGAGVQTIGINPAAAAAADSITIAFRARPSGDFALRRIETVPEPASMAAIGLGIAGLIARRRRKA